MESHYLVRRTIRSQFTLCHIIHLYAFATVILTIHGFMHTTYFIITRINGRTFHEQRRYNRKLNQFPQSWVTDVPLRVGKYSESTPSKGLKTVLIR